MAYIYESPDSGQTVYRRDFGSNQRKLHHTVDPAFQRQQQRLEKFRKIIQQARHDPELDHMLEQIEIYSSLKNTP
jgi:hypothetical protein